VVPAQAVRVACLGASASSSRQRCSGPGGLVGGVEQLDQQRLGADRVQAKLELGDHAEVPAAAAQSPIQLGVLLLADVQDLAVGGDQLEAGDVVAGQPVAAGQPAHPAAQGEPADAGVGDVAGGGGQPEPLGGPVQRAQQRAAADPGATLLRVDTDAAEG
jgi:hypothetical protein